MKEIPSLTKYLSIGLGLFKFKNKDGKDVKILDPNNPFHKLLVWYYIKKYKFKLKKTVNPYIEHAKREFKTLGYIPLDQNQEDGPNKWIQENVNKLLEEFYSQGHTNISSDYCIEYFTKLAKFKPLSPLTGEDDEWEKIDSNHSCPEVYYQNKRCSHVFKREDGLAYDIDAYMFWYWSERQLEEDEEGYPGIIPYKAYFSGKYAVKVIEFPYIPETEYIKVVSYEIDKETKEPKKGTDFWYTEYPKWIVDEYNETFKE